MCVCVNYTDIDLVATDSSGEILARQCESNETDACFQTGSSSWVRLLISDSEFSGRSASLEAFSVSTSQSSAIRCSRIVRAVEAGVRMRRSQALHKLPCVSLDWVKCVGSLRYRLQDRQHRAEPFLNEGNYETASLSQTIYL